ncbi:hypothetical protein BN891_48880 [Bacteroides xylanisolvens SD CC 2a]|nr:hypothetical protein BN891_48880 [Bacteroides xylanisolvens SD CC 2a]
MSVFRLLLSLNINKLRNHFVRICPAKNTYHICMFCNFANKKMTEQ